MFKMWQNYVDRYNKFQWWLSGLIYGFFLGKWFEKTRRVHSMWNPAVYERLTWWDAFILTLDMEWTLGYSSDEIVTWLLDRGYTFPITTDSSHTAFCSTVQCYCSDEAQSSQRGNKDDEDLTIPNFLQT